MKIEKALTLLFKYEVPEHIINHSYKVTKIANIICEELIDEGSCIDISLVVLSALLHDITKYQSILNRGEDHSVTGGILLRNLGYPDIAEIIESHIVIKNDKLFPLEKMVVFYADKRVKHDEIVSLEERYRDLKERYGKNIKSKTLIDYGYLKAKKIEEKLFDKLSIKPYQINLL